MQTEKSSSLHPIEVKIIDDFVGQRLDLLLSKLYQQFSRNRIQSAIKNGEILVNHKLCKPKTILNPLDLVTGNIVEMIEVEDQPENIPLEIIYQDDDIIVINKPSNLVVHPAPGNKNNTLLNALLYHFPNTRNLPRAGIVHRLDKDTSGIMVVAHSLNAYHHLVTELQQRDMGRSYYALVYGYITAGATIDQSIGRDRNDRKKMAIRSDGKHAVTHYKIKERYDNFTLLDLQLETGRTHQIRVHLTSINHSIVGDQTYKSKQLMPKHTPEKIREIIDNFPRQALHAYNLTLTHPKTKERLNFTAPMAEDFLELLDQLSN